MEKRDQILKDFEDDFIRSWEEFPDILLYMDQVITLMEDQVFFKESQGSMTPSMVNNYVKAGLLARAEKKKYGRDHLARLSMIGIIKQVLSLKEMESLFSDFPSDRDGYELYYRILEQAKKEVLEEIKDYDGEKVLLHLIMKSYLYKVLAQELLNED